MRNHKQTPDLLTWRRVASGVYESTDGLMRSRKLGGGFWSSEVRASLCAEWHASATFKSGRECIWQSLSVAQHEARRASEA